MISGPLSDLSAKKHAAFATEHDSVFLSVILEAERRSSIPLFVSSFGQIDFFLSYVLATMLPNGGKAGRKLHNLRLTRRDASISKLGRRFFDSRERKESGRKLLGSRKMSC